MNWCDTGVVSVLLPVVVVGFPAAAAREASLLVPLLLVAPLKCDVNNCLVNRATDEELNMIDYLDFLLLLLLLLLLGSGYNE